MYETLSTTQHNTTQRIAIIILIAVFSIAGFTSCKKKPTQIADFNMEEPDQPTGLEPPTTDTGSSSGGGDNSSGGGDNGSGGGTTNPENPETPKPQEPTYPSYTYYRVFVPWALTPTENTTVVSYQDTNKLAELWKAMMKRKGAGDADVFHIRNNGWAKGVNADNKDADNNDTIRHELRYSPWNLRIGGENPNPNDVDIYFPNGSFGRYQPVKKFLGAAIVYYANTGPYDKVFTVGGIYQVDVGNSDYKNQGSDGLNVFMGNKDKGDVEIVVLNTSLKGKHFNGYGVDVYSKDGSKDASSLIAKEPNWLMENLPKREQFNHTVREGWYEILWIAGPPQGYNWQTGVYPSNYK